MSDKHKWTKEDDMIAFYLYKHRNHTCDLTCDLDYSKQALSERMGTPLRSLDLRIENFAALAGEGKMDHCAASTVAVYHEYKDMPDDLFRDEVMKIIQRL